MFDIKEQFPNILINEPLGKYSTFQIGGISDYFYIVKKTSELSSLIEFCKKNDISFYIFAGGSNILFSDKGFRGLIIKIETEDIETNGTQVTADAGVKIPDLVQFSVNQGLSGLEPWIGLPGTVGAAVRGNAGCNGLETLECMASATLLDPKSGKIRTELAPYFDFSYRHSKLADTGEIVLSATFNCQKRTVSIEEQQATINEHRKSRLSKQPFGCTTGSFFKNPLPDKPAGYLIDQAGLKGATHGGAQISEKHANFFLNKGGATSEDIIALSELAQREVKSKFGLDLKREVQVVPETLT